jgi:hypothetical protein
MQTTRESSVLFSLRELRDLERQRVADEARAERERNDAAETARVALAECRRREELELRLEAEARARILAERLAGIAPEAAPQPAPVESPVVSLRPRRSLVPWIAAMLVTASSAAWALSRAPEVLPPTPQVVIRTIYLEPPPPPAPRAQVAPPPGIPVVPPKVAPVVRPKVIPIIKPPSGPVIAKKPECIDPRDPLCGLD